jgi:hypothetical protein
MVVKAHLIDEHLESLEWFEPIFDRSGEIVHGLGIIALWRERGIQIASCTEWTPIGSRHRIRRIRAGHLLLSVRCELIMIGRRCESVVADRSPLEM